MASLKPLSHIIHEERERKPMEINATPINMQYFASIAL